MLGHVATTPDLTHQSNPLSHPFFGTTGDANFEDPENAQAIVVPGWEISADMEQDKWDAILEHPQIVFARTSPQQKLVIVENNQVCCGRSLIRISVCALYSLLTRFCLVNDFTSLWRRSIEFLLVA